MPIHTSRVGVRRMGPVFFSVVPTERTRSNGHKPEHQKFHLNMRGNFFNLRVADPWSRLPREMQESSSLEAFTTCLVVFLCDFLWVNLPWQRNWT